MPNQVRQGQIYKAENAKLFFFLVTAEALPLTAGCDAVTELVLKQQLTATTAFKALAVPLAWIAAVLYTSKFLLRKLSD